MCDVKVAKAMSGAECWKTTKRLTVSKLTDRKITDDFSRDLDAKMSELPTVPINIKEQWASVRDTVYSVALEYFGRAKRKHQA
ncbi:hypothetical protein HOLleu_32830 [Holothuria leucospilota]|uniref:Uncharacterized protein n=1 Tax=Holothuria leucospilota TaxID=206669 RepID=A0A9Q1H0D1_HOLLE|nr:hypothetical protein HOLleu_32830 [Holothuria leucospilota]